MVANLRGCLEIIKLYINLQKVLHTTLDPTLSLHSVVDRNFSPTEASVLEQIKRWPKNTPIIIPPAAWVSPRKGTIVLQNETWDYIFHGAGLSFMNQLTSQDVSIEYSQEGLICFTEFTFSLYLETTPSSESGVRQIRDNYQEIFEKIVRLDYLIKTLPLLPGDDQTFILANE